MSPRPLKNARSGGCFAIMFFSVFMVFPLFAFWGMANKWPGESGDTIIFFAVFGLFFLVGLGGVIAGIRTLLRSRKSLSVQVPTMLSGAALPPPVKSERQASGYYRLAPEASHRAAFWTMLAIALFWNSITWGVLIGVNKESDDKAPLWVLLIFVTAGLFLVAYAVYLFLVRIMVGETALEINATELTPGQSVELRIAQPGRYAIDSLSIDLICREKATYRAGTDTTTKTEIVHEIPVCFLTKLQARDQQSLAQQSFKIPEYATLSFKSPNNEITWLIQVKLILPGRPDVSQMFPIRIVSPEILKSEPHTRG